MAWEVPNTVQSWTLWISRCLLSGSTRFKTPLPAHHELSWDLTNLQQKLKLPHSFSQPFQKPWEAQIIHYNYILTSPISPSTPSAWGEVGYEIGKEVTEKDRERGEGSSISTISACNCSSFLNCPLLKATVPCSPPLHHPTLILLNSSCMCLLRYKDLQDKARARHTLCKVSHPPSTPRLYNQPCRRLPFVRVIQIPHQNSTKWCLQSDNHPLGHYYVRK